MIATLLAVAMPMIHAQTISPERLTEVAKDVAAQAIVEFKSINLKPDEIEISLVDLNRGNGTYTMGSFNGDVNMYPASVVKLIYAGYLVQALDKKQVAYSKELDRAVKDMLIESSNDGTALVLDTITGTTGGPELPPKALAAWMEKRQAVNRWLVGLGYQNQNACQKPWNEGPYGRERQGYGPNFEKRNALSPNACARMMAEIALYKVASQERSDWILGYMHRVTGANGDDAGAQSKGFLGAAMPADFERWSKAGWAYQVRHDVCFIKTPQGREMVLAVFTDHHGADEKLLPFVGQQLLNELGLTTP